MSLSVFKYEFKISLKFGSSSCDKFGSKLLLKLNRVSQKLYFKLKQTYLRDICEFQFNESETKDGCSYRCSSSLFLSIPNPYLRSFEWHLHERPDSSEVPTSLDSRKEVNFPEKKTWDRVDREDGGGVTSGNWVKSKRTSSTALKSERKSIVDESRRERKRRVRRE